MGFNDVDIKVIGGSDIISTLQTYTTKILKPNIVDGKNILTQQMVSAKNTKYVIKYDYVLDEDITVPKNCVLEFDGGTLANGEIEFNETCVINPSFNRCKLSGYIKIDGIIKDSDFYKNTDNDESDILKWLIEQAGHNNTTLQLSKDYTVNTHNHVYSPGNYCLVSLYKCSFKILGNGHTIYDTFLFPKNISTQFIAAKECYNIVIKDLYFECLENSSNNITEAGITGNEVNAGTGGATVLRLFGDTNNVKIYNGRCRKCFSYLFAGRDPQVGVEDTERTDSDDNFVVKGFTDIYADISDAYDTSYPVGIYKGSNITCFINFLYAHRGCRLQGVTNGKIHINGAFVTTPVILLLKDSISYTDNNYTERVFSCCSNIDAIINRLDIEDSIVGRNWYDIALVIVKK